MDGFSHKLDVLATRVFQALSRCEVSQCSRVCLSYLSQAGTLELLCIIVGVCCILGVLCSTAPQVDCCAVGSQDNMQNII